MRMIVPALPPHGELVLDDLPSAWESGGYGPTEIIYYIGEQCSHVSVFVGIDDERDEKQAGSATFQIWADGARLLRPVETDGGDTNSYDRGDWAAPTLICGEMYMKDRFG